MGRANLEMKSPSTMPSTLHDQINYNKKVNESKNDGNNNKKIILKSEKME